MERDWINVNKRADIKGGWYEVYNPNKAGLCPFEYAFYRNYNGIWIIESGDQIHPSHYRELPNEPTNE